MARFSLRLLVGTRALGGFLFALFEPMVPVAESGGKAPGIGKTAGAKRFCSDAKLPCTASNATSPAGYGGF